jgi:MFS family permease
MSKAATIRKKERWVMAIFFVLAGIIVATWSSRIPEVQHRLQMNDAAWGAVLFAQPVGLIIGLLVSSWLVVRFGSRTVMVVCCIISSGLLCLLGIAYSGGQLMVVLFLFGFFRTIFNLAINTNAIDVQQLYERPIVATFHGLWSLACFVAAAIGTVMIILNIVPALHFVLVAALCIMATFLSRSSHRRQEHLVPQKRPFFVKPDKYLLLLGGITFCVMICENTMFDWSVHYFKNVVHADKKWVTLGYSAFIIAMTLGRLVGDKLIGKYGAIRMLMINGIVMAAGSAVAAWFPFLVPAAIGFLLVGLGDSVIVPIVYTLSAKSTKMETGYAIASVTLIGYAGFLAGPLLTGFISESVGLQWAFAIMCLFSVVITFLALILKKYFSV